MSGIRKKVTLQYDSELGTVKTSWFANSAITNDGESEFQAPGCNVLGYDGIKLEAAKECLEEMLVIVNNAIENN